MPLPALLAHDLMALWAGNLPRGPGQVLTADRQTIRALHGLPGLHTGAPALAEIQPKSTRKA